ncbi:MAG: histidine kinase [Cytophagales bacterium]|nr:histidine kinase [Cytophagales bacterium]
MISRRKIILYFGLAGILPATLFTFQKIYAGEVTQFDLPFFIRVAINLCMSCIITALVSASVIYSIQVLDRYFPWEKGIWKRIITEFFYTNMVSVISILIIYNLIFFAGLSKFEYNEHIVKGIVISIFLNLFLTTFYEGIRLFNNWKHSLIEAERLEKENIASKFEALKNQVNPHFLFNSLNTLSSLIYSDTAKAELFIDEFASIYRYVLDNRDRLLVSLKEEIDFINSFVYLLKIRFGEGLKFNLRIDGEKLKHCLPTLSLQLLVENALKHNVVTKDKPLEVSISTEEDCVLVKNNLQYREKDSLNTGIGLENLKERYKLLSKLKPSFEIENDYYIAKLPLIQPE